MQLLALVLPYLSGLWKSRTPCGYVTFFNFLLVNNMYSTDVQVPVPVVVMLDIKYTKISALKSKRRILPKESVFEPKPFMN